MVTDYYDELKIAIDKISVLVDKYRNKPKYQVCLYLGIVNDGKLDHGFNCEEFFTKVTTNLGESMSIWEDGISHTTKFDLYTLDDDPTTLIEHHLTSNDIYKKKILHEYNYQYKNTPFDFQVIVFEYTKINQLPLDIELSGQYASTDYHLRNSNVQLYTFETETDDQIEIEQGLLVKTKGLSTTEHSSVYIAHDLLLRVRDIIDMCEPIKNATLTLVSEYNG